MYLCTKYDYYTFILLLTCGVVVFFISVVETCIGSYAKSGLPWCPFSTYIVHIVLFMSRSCSFIVNC